MTPGFSQSDTTVLSQSEFRFPETHPGEVFLVKKVILSPKGSLPKTAAVEASTTPGAAPASKTPAPLANRDLRGRSATGEGEYQKRMERIRQKQGLPTANLAAQEAGRPFKSPETFQMPEGSRHAILSNSPRIRTGKDLRELEKAERAALRRRIGSLEPSFAVDLESRNASEAIDVYVTLVVENPGYLDKQKTSLEEQKAHAQKWARLKSVAKKEEVLRQYGLEESREHPINTPGAFVARATKSKILAMAHNPAVASIEEKRAPGLTTVPGVSPPVAMDLINSAYNPANQMVNYVSSSISVATLEMGLTNAFVGAIAPSERPDGYTVFNPSSGGDAVHSAGTYHLLSLGTPGFSRYHFANGWYGPYSGIYDSLLAHNVQSISQSYHSWWYSPLSADSRFVDRLSYGYPYTTVVMPTCNDGHAYAPCNQPYNALSVGNVQHYDLTSYNVDFWSMSGGSIVSEDYYATQTKNPAPYYGYTSDREMPYLVAPGWRPDPYWGIWDSTLSWGPGGGTSLSAPVLAAMAANVASVSSYMSYYPELVRAALLVTAENVDGGYWNPGYTDQKDGAGTVSGANAVKFVAEGTQFDPGPGNSDYPVISGLDHDEFYERDFDTTTSHWYYYIVPPQLPSGKHLRVVLTWNSSPGLNYAENEISDLDVYVEANSYWKGSWSRNGNIEMVDIPAGSLSVNGVYAIQVIPGVYQKATDGPENVSYAIAWTWVKDHAD